jgi:hypothetical protein
MDSVEVWTLHCEFTVAEALTVAAAVPASAAVGTADIEPARASARLDSAIRDFGDFGGFE